MTRLESIFLHGVSWMSHLYLPINIIFVIPTAVVVSEVETLVGFRNIVLSRVELMDDVSESS